MPDTPETPLVDAFPHVIGNSFTLTIGGSASCWPANISAGEAFTIPTGRRYTGSALFVTTNALLSFRAEAAGTITAAYLYIPTNTSATTRSPRCTPRSRGSSPRER